MRVGRGELRRKRKGNCAEMQAGRERCVQGKIAELGELHMQGVIGVGKRLKVVERELSIRIGAILAGVVLLELIKVSCKLNDVLRGGEERNGK